MNSIKYVGLDVHKKITVIVVINDRGEVESLSQVKTKSETIGDFIRGLSGTVKVIFEEGTQATWLYHLLNQLVWSVTVCNRRTTNKGGNKDDDKDAEQLARDLRSGNVKTVYKGDEQYQELKQICRTYDNLVQDSTRARNRLKCIYRGRGIDCSGQSVFRSDLREEWLEKLPNEALRFRCRILLNQIDNISLLRKEAKNKLIDEAKKRSAYKILLTLPGFGPVRVSQLIADIGTPDRFRTKRQFWPYCGFAVITRSSADYDIIDDRITKQRKKVSTRGLNYNCNPRIKQLFKGAALTALNNEDFKTYYEQQKKNGTKPEIALVSVARKLSAIALAIWKQGKAFDAKVSFAKA